MLAIGLATLASVAYPLLVYLFAQDLSNTVIAVFIVIVTALRFALTRRFNDPVQWLALLVVMIYSTLLLLQNNTLLPRLYPSLLSLMVATVFGSSLLGSEPLLLRMARLTQSDIPPQALPYLWWLTLIWTLLLIANALTAAVLAVYAQVKIWALYTGLWSYLIFAGFFVLEWAYRQHYKRRHRQEDTN